MAVGVSVANLANPVLNWLRGVAPAAVPGLYAKLHVGDPGAAGTASPSAVTARQQVTMNAASGGSMSLNSVAGSWTMTATENVTHLSIHDDPTAGNFRWSVLLTNARSVVSGDTLTLTTLTLGNTPLAA
ncbi:hypothetical protein NTR1_49 [Nocardia phage NTR1]|nr:hypothetical protein NTR1_49 [Nocardia phage NTR1]